jgi:hypothetical protein
MKFSAQTLAHSHNLVKNIEVQRQRQYVLFQDNLIKAAGDDLELFCSYCLYVLPTQLWTLIEDLERTEERLQKTDSIRLTEQLKYFKKSVIKSLVSAMLYRKKGESWNVKLLEVISLLS